MPTRLSYREPACSTRHGNRGLAQIATEKMEKRRALIGQKFYALFIPICSVVMFHAMNGLFSIDGDTPVFTEHLQCPFHALGFPFSAPSFMEYIEAWKLRMRTVDRDNLRKNDRSYHLPDSGVEMSEDLFRNRAIFEHSSYPTPFSRRAYQFGFQFHFLVI